MLCYREGITCSLHPRHSDAMRLGALRLPSHTPWHPYVPMRHGVRTFPSHAPWRPGVPSHAPWRRRLPTIVTIVLTTVHNAVGHNAEGCYNYPPLMGPRPRAPVFLSCDNMHSLDNCDNCNKCCLVPAVGKPAVTVVISSGKNHYNASLSRPPPLLLILRSYIIMAFLAPAGFFEAADHFLGIGHIIVRNPLVVFGRPSCPLDQVINLTPNRLLVSDLLKLIFVRVIFKFREQ